MNVKLILCTIHIHSCVVSEPYSEDPDSRSWRYRVMDIDVFVDGPSYLVRQLQEWLERSGKDLDSLIVSTYMYNVMY